MVVCCSARVRKLRVSLPAETATPIGKLASEYRFVKVKPPELLLELELLLLELELEDELLLEPPDDPPPQPQAPKAENTTAKPIFLRFCLITNP
jgi:hypothetical protein